MFTGGPLSHLEQACQYGLGDLHLFWLDASYSGADHERKDMGGVSGHIRLRLPAGLDALWWELLVLGQYPGIGQRSALRHQEIDP